METAPLACIVAHTAEGLIANHIPLTPAADGILISHVALANEMHRMVTDCQEVLAIFRGDDSYISPNFYPTKPEHHRHVPTWNYQVVHAYGEITSQHDEHTKRAAVGLLTRYHERRLNGKDAWRMADAPGDYMQQMLANIVTFRIKVQKTLAKSKLSQNREEQDYLGAIKGLRASGQQRLAERMENGWRGRSKPKAFRSRQGRPGDWRIWTRPYRRWWNVDHGFNLSPETPFCVS